MKSVLCRLAAIVALCAIFLPVQASEVDVFDPVQYKTEIVLPTLEAMEAAFPGASHPAAVNLMVGITFHESKGGTYLRQKARGGGVVLDGGLGVNQVESKTHQSVYNHFLRYKPERLEFARSMLPAGSIVRVSETEFEVDDAPLIHDLSYATFVGRTVIYMRRFEWPEDHRDVEALGVIWDEQYNRNPRAGFVHQFKRDFPRRVL